MRFLRGRRNTLEACRNSRVGFSWPALHFVLLERRFSWQAQRFLTWRRCFFVESQWQGCANVTQRQNSWQGQHFVSVLKSGESFAKFILFELCKNSFIRKTRRKSSILSFNVSKLEEVSHELLFWDLLGGCSGILRGKGNTLEACQ